MQRSRRFLRTLLIPPVVPPHQSLDDREEQQAQGEDEDGEDAQADECQDDDGVEVELVGALGREAIHQGITFRSSPLGERSCVFIGNNYDHLATVVGSPAVRR